LSESLQGARVALLEARRESELASLVRRHGGVPVCVPALREVERDCAAQLAKAVGALGREQAVVVLATGVGLERCLAVAKELGRLEEFRAGLTRSTVVCRGPKPVAVLKREGLTAHIRAEPPHTSVELLAALATLDVAGREVVYVHDGGANRGVVEDLLRRGAQVAEVEPYGWALPEDVGPLVQLVRDIVAGQVDALAVTTQIQAVHLFEVAESVGQRPALVEALRERVIVAAVGPTSARALERLGAPPHVIPAASKMGTLVVALATRMSRPASP
jgi:uroporphyrinogen-III synthase